MTAVRVPSQAGVPRLLADPVASRPAANTVPTGTWFYSTDEDTIYRSDGTEWSAGIGSGGGSEVTPVAYQESPTVTTLRDALVTLGFMEGAPGGSWTPADLPGLQVWLEADAITGLSDTDPVATWADLSVNGHDFVQATSGRRPLYRTGIINGLPVVRFDGTDDRLSNTDAITYGTVFMVTEKGSAGIIWGAGAAGTATEYIGSPSGAPSEFFLAWNGDTSSSSSTGRALIDAGLDTYEANTDHQLRKGGDTVLTGSSPLSTPPSRSQSYLGTRNQLNSFFGGDIALFIVTNAVLSSSDRTALETWATTKYGL